MDNQAGALWRSYMPPKIRTLKGFLLLLATSLIATACGTVDERQHIDPASPPEPIQEFQWNSQAIGYDDTSLELSGQSASKTVRLIGAGADIWGARDEFIYFYTQVEGDFQLTARLDSFDHADPWSKAGLMVRESLDPSARNSLIHTSGSSGAVLQARETLGGVTNNDGGKDPSVSAPNSWMRLTRVEGVIAGELSNDGVNWRELGRYELELASTVHIGLAVTAHEPSSVAEAVFSHLSVRDDNVQLPAPEPDPAVPEPVPTDPEPNDPEPEPTISDDLSRALEETWSTPAGGGNQGDTEGPGNQGSPDGAPGKGALGGGQGDWELAGRSLVSGYSIKDTKEEGVVVLDITVDRQGNVLTAKWSPQSNTTSTYLTNKAIHAAKRYKFSPKSNAAIEQRGKIRFIFQLQ